MATQDAGDLKELLSLESVTVIGILVVLCILLIWDKIRQEKRFNELMAQHNLEEKENKAFLVDLVTKNVSAMRQLKTTIDDIKHGIFNK